MSKEKYYVLHLDDYAAAQFTSVGKMYFAPRENYRNRAYRTQKEFFHNILL